MQNQNFPRSRDTDTKIIGRARKTISAPISLAHNWEYLANTAMLIGGGTLRYDFTTG
ncbi:hypothetical protein [Rathayibacter toxicus]|uniref:hypothetical protein n=1 Tax=Rathayibacter toxicus TaxID=145458 RepID=UPI000B27FCBE|nr:hypothetical protein [Rathayibacter toxicus]QOD08268.1 hypothetical protein AYW78_10625 [Rathayibacter toxicus]QOD10369.1 hypothetical protein BSG36_10810 [Rathayibacter toxicus]